MTACRLRTTLVLTGVALAGTGTPAGSQERVLEQDPALDNLVHPVGYVPAQPGTLGHVERRGSGGRTLILIPGQGFGGSAFEDLTALLEDRYTLWVVTPAGLGGTAAPPMPPAGTSYSEQTWIRGAASAVLRLIESEGIDAPILVGHMTLGTHIALRAALERPDLIGGVVLLAGEAVRPLDPSTATRIPPEARRQAIDQVWAPTWFRTVTERTWDSNMWSPAVYSRDRAVAARLWAESAAVPVPVMVRYLCEMLAADLSVDADRLQVRTLVVRPGFTAAFRADAANRNAVLFFHDSWDAWASHPHVHITTLPDAHVFLMVDAPDAVRHAIAGFIEEGTG